MLEIGEGARAGAATGPRWARTTPTASPWPPSCWPSAATRSTTTAEVALEVAPDRVDVVGPVLDRCRTRSAAWGPGAVVGLAGLAASRPAEVDRLQPPRRHPLALPAPARGPGAVPGTGRAARPAAPAAGAACPPRPAPRAARPTTVGRFRCRMSPGASPDSMAVARWSGARASSSSRARSSSAARGRSTPARPAGSGQGWPQEQRAGRDLAAGPDGVVEGHVVAADPPAPGAGPGLAEHADEVQLGSRPGGDGPAVVARRQPSLASSTFSSPMTVAAVA